MHCVVTDTISSLLLTNTVASFDIILTMYHDNLYNKTNEMHFLEFYSDNILYMFQIGKLFIFRRQFYCTWTLWYVSCIHVD